MLHRTSVLPPNPTLHSAWVCSGGHSFPKIQQWIFSIWSAKYSSFLHLLRFFFFCTNMSIIYLWSSALLSLYCNNFTLSLSHLIQGTILKMPTASQPFIVWNKSTFFISFLLARHIAGGHLRYTLKFQENTSLIGSSTPSFCLWNYIIRSIYFCYCILFLDHFNPRHLAQICYIQCWILVQKGWIRDMLTHVETTWKLRFY